MNKFDNNFLDARDLIDCLSRGCEVSFLYESKQYSITHTDMGISIMEFYNENSEKLYTDAVQALEYPIGQKKLKDILADMKITDRSF